MSRSHNLGWVILFLATNVVASDPFVLWQEQYFVGGANNPAAAPGADPFGKGISNTNQFRLGLIPTNPASLFRILGVQPAGSNVVITWQTAGGSKTNVIDAATGTLTGNWLPTGLTNIITTLGDVVTNAVDVGGATNSRARFYRVRLVDDVPHILSALTVALTGNLVLTNSSLQFSVVARDQFGNPMTVPLMWTVNGGGTISSNGLFNAGSTPTGAYVVTVGAGGVNAVAMFIVTDDVREDRNPFGFASSAETSGNYPRFEPLLQQAGASWYRRFGTWDSIQPTSNVWNWASMDSLTATSAVNGVNLVGFLGLFATWASSGQSNTTTFPVTNIAHWTNYVWNIVNRYHPMVRYWEVWNEPNGSFGVNCTSTNYADLVRWGHDAAQTADPTSRIGLSCASIDVPWLDMVLRSGASNKFDFVCVHPYEMQGLIPAGFEKKYLGMGDNLRQMLAANKQSTNAVQLWITETGTTSSNSPNAMLDAAQAQRVFKTYILSLAQGFARICWFEAYGGVNYGAGLDMGLIRKDWTLRPAYAALQTLTDNLGPSPVWIGWQQPGNSNGYGFVFQNTLLAPTGFVMAAWMSPGQTAALTFAGNVRVAGLTGNVATVTAGAPIILSNSPVLVLDVPASSATNASRALWPWGGIFNTTNQVYCRLGSTNANFGASVPGTNSNTAVTFFGTDCRKLTGNIIQFVVDPTFMSFTDSNVTVTVIAAATNGLPSGFNFKYLARGITTKSNYKSAGIWWDIPGDGQWHTNSWTVKDACFTGKWGYDWYFDRAGGGSNSNACYIKEVSVKKN